MIPLAIVAAALFALGWGLGALFGYFFSEAVNSDVFGPEHDEPIQVVPARW